MPPPLFSAGQRNPLFQHVTPDVSRTAPVNRGHGDTVAGDSEHGSNRCGNGKSHSRPDLEREGPQFTALATPPGRCLAPGPPPVPLQGRPASKSCLMAGFAGGPHRWHSRRVGVVAGGERQRGKGGCDATPQGRPHAEALRKPGSLQTRQVKRRLGSEAEIPDRQNKSLSREVCNSLSISGAPIRS